MIPERANSLAVVEGMLSRFFQATAAASTISMSSRPTLKVLAEKRQRVLCKPPGERELRIVQETRTWRPIPKGVELPRCPNVPLTERVEAEPTTSSRYSFFQGHERSLDPGSLWRAARHSRTNGAKPTDLRRHSAFASDLR